MSRVLPCPYCGSAMWDHMSTCDSCKPHNSNSKLDNYLVLVAKLRSDLDIYLLQSGENITLKKQLIKLLIELDETGF